MSINYQFEDKQGKPVPLAKIDHFICELTGTPEDEVRYSPDYDMVAWMGIGTLLTQLLAGHLAAAFNAQVEKRKAEGAPYSDNDWALMELFLCDEFKFKAWR
jgi:hypothetical protein